LVLACAVPVRHLMPDGRLSAHAPTRGVRLRDDGLLVYDVLHREGESAGGQQETLPLSTP
jgi:hypothetical protein